jgi:ABC-type multidrug transport system ATPase subunit
LSDVQAISDQVAIMNKGQLIYQGLVSELLDVDTIDLKIEAVPAQNLETLEKMSDSLSKEAGKWVFTVSTQKQRKELEGYLTKENLKLESTAISYKELEPVFLSKIEENNRQRGL